MSDTPKNFYKKLLGSKGEKIAEKYLKKQGYAILEKNYKTHYGEADLIASKDGVIVFIEVKTRSGDEFGAPSEAVTKKKQEKYFKVATEYLMRKDKMDALCRFDVVEIENGQINLINDAFCM